MTGEGVQVFRLIIHRFGAVPVTIATTIFSVIFSVTVVTTTSILFGYRQLGFAIAVSAIVPLLLAPGVFFGFLRLLEQLDRTEAELRRAMANVRTLSGLLPICNSCKKIRDDQGYWNRIEEYLAKHSSAAFSHGLCPDCVERQYQEYVREAGSLQSKAP